MAQNDFSLANQGFPSMRADMNSAFQALATNSSGSTEPPTTYAYQWWYDTANDILKIRDSANDSWIDFATFDQTTESWSFSGLSVDGDIRSGGSIRTTGLTTTGDATEPHFSFTSDDDTGMYRAGSGELGFSTNGVEAFRVDGSQNTGFGTGSPDAKVHITSESPRVRFEETDASQEYSIGGGGGNFLIVDENTGSIPVTIEAGAPSNSIRVESSGEAGFGVSNPTARIDADGDIRASGAIRTTGLTSTGDATAPHFSFTSDDDTGMYRAGANKIGFSTDGVERMLLSSSGAAVSGTVTATGWSGGTQSEATWVEGTSKTEGIVSPEKIKAAIDASGNPVKAWVNFDGTGTVSIRESFNVSSITDNGTGDYTVNFATALTDANYVFHGSASRAPSETAQRMVHYEEGATRTSNALRIGVAQANSTGPQYRDNEFVEITVVR